MRERKAIRAKKILEREELVSLRLTLQDQLNEALRLCRGKVDEETLLKICPTVDIKGAIEIGLLIVEKNGDGKFFFVAGPNLEKTNCDVTKAINLSALVALAAAR
jgi:hypothetical protein